jgi:2-succinyl-6-hydroxy-2,4-cyclohexadiene-1-carboxylate synthase
MSDFVIRPTHRWGQGARQALLLHGFSGSAHAFDHLEPWVGDLVTAHCVDLPGHHGAPLPPELGTEGFLATVDALAEGIDRPLDVIGYSQGARLALGLAVRHPSKVTRLVLESGASGLRQRRERLLRRLSDDTLAELLLSGGVDAFIDRWERLPLFAGVRALPEADRAALRARRVSHTAEGLAGALRCLGQGVQPDFAPALPGLHVPTLLITGAADQKYTRIARRLATDLPLAWRVTLPGVNHAPHLERPEAWAAEVRGFLAARWRDETVGPEELSS